MGDVGALAKPPYGLTDNLQSLLRTSDLVFIDPVTTGYSRASKGHQVGDFHGYTRDIESVSEFIRLWTSRHDRWLSPKFLAGESYGTTRAAALAAHLADGLRAVPERSDARSPRCWTSPRSTSPRATTCRTRSTCRPTPPPRTSTA